MLCMCVDETVCLCVTVCSVWGCCKYSCCTNEIYLSCSLACSLTCLGIDVYTSEWSQYRSQSIYELANGHKYCWETSGHFIFNFFFFFSYSSIVFHLCMYICRIHSSTFISSTFLGFLNRSIPRLRAIFHFGAAINNKWHAFLHIPMSISIDANV